MAEKRKLLCDRCKVELEEIDVQFTYLNKNFRHKVPRCPKCGQVSLPEELVLGRMDEVEKSLEEK
ncbi:MAG: DVU_1557 family redox protein [Anaerovoracaceae bacterium]|jgi:NAD-dependent SIR2 family protein deacetylase